jgi:hypothetical protein
MRRADDSETVLRLVVANGVPAREGRAGLLHLRRRGVEDRAYRLDRELLRERGDGEREQGFPSHSEDVVQGVDRRDGTEERRVVDHGRKEVGREDEGALVVEAVDGRVVRRREPDEQVLRIGGAKPARSSSSRPAAYLAAQPPPASRPASRAVVSTRWRLPPARLGVRA